MDRGDIFWVDLPRPQGTAEQAGIRPGIVIVANASVSTVITIPLTSNSRALRFPGTLMIKRDPVNGLSDDSVALLFQIRALDRSRFRGRIGKLGPGDMLELNKRLAVLLGFQA